MEIDWHRILFSDHPYSFFLEILFRTPIIFLAVVIVLRLTGKRGVQQLSIFEMVMIITLGSAAGDSMFYEDVGILHAISVFLIVLVLYRVIIYIITNSEKAEMIIEGKPMYLIKGGQFCLKELNNDELGSDEFFGELRQRNIEHLGQVKYAILEDNGKISVFYYPDHEVKPGLPILPEAYDQKNSVIKKTGLYACSKCGTTSQLLATTENYCVNCNHNEFVLAIDLKRIT
jgi:uncharacterized membrane protein YcaP (DUF421 family)